ncbi:MAG: helix-turn-helix domain-containing protein [Intestinibacillus sp.]
MEDIKSNIKQIINTIQATYGIRAIYIDNVQNLKYDASEKEFINDFSCLGLNQILQFLSEQFRMPVNENTYYTYFLQNNLVCNIAMLDAGGEHVGAIVTQPVFMNKPTQTEIDGLLLQTEKPPKKYNNLYNTLLRVPIVPYEKIQPMGEFLTVLIQTACQHRSIRQILCSGLDKTSPASDALVKKVKVTASYAENAHKSNPYINYTQLKEFIQNGDPVGLSCLLDKLNPGDAHLGVFDPSNPIRSMKNLCISLCAMSCCIAMESNAPYQKMMDMADEAIRQVENMGNLRDIYEHTKNVMISYAKSVNVIRIVAYSKPVRLALDYIDMHYADKITLETLSEHIGLSASYLSCQMKKETGLNLTDNINKRRVERSKKLLMETNLNNLEIAQNVGFNYANHFASIFKKFTKSTPSEYKKTQGLRKGKKEFHHPAEISPVVMDELQNALSLLPEIYDVARLVDPVNQDSWIIFSKDARITGGVCYSLWNGEKPCGNCIAMQARQSNRPSFKIEQMKNQKYFVIAMPKVLSSTTYVIEVLVNITEYA